ncbi:MAG: hypothetical protein HY855_01195 [Burkholderiales bacterium]|nr:hypothetical protein [Burkholderiales bacterium]
MLVEKVLGAIGFIVCVLLLVRMALPPRRRQAFDSTARRAWARTVDLAQRLVRWRPSSRRQAARAAEEAIERARRQGGEWDGNVYRPKSFKGPRKPH